ncbi:MAG: FAD-binding protein [Pseudomonadota bacterium]
MSVRRVTSHEFELHVPLIIVGAGACGLSAALAAHDAGAEPLVLERDINPVGSTGMSYGAICAAGTRQQRAAGIEDTAQSLQRDINAMTRGQTDPALAALVAREAGPAVEWLADSHGVSLTVETSWTGMGHRQPRLHAPEDRSGQTLLNFLLTAIARAEIDLVTGARVSTLFADADNRVLGLEIERPDGDRETIGCDALILANSGFGANRDMVKKHMPAVGGARYYGHEGNLGDGILWGQALGGAVADMGAYQALGSLADPQALVIPHTLLIGGGIQVNSDGLRFENELDNISGQALTILQQPGGICWMVYDQRLHESALARFQEYRDAEAIGAAKTAGTIAELARRCKLPENTLTETLAEVAEFGQREQTDEYGRSFKSGERLRPPYFAIRVGAALFHTQGGLLVNEQARVTDERGQALPNLFAGGGAARSVSGPGEWGYLPGMGLCTAVTLGRIAGTEAAKQIRE